MKGLLLAPVRLVPTLARHRFLLRQLAWRSFSVRHAGNYLGWLWTPVSTVVQIVLFMVVFSVILDIKIEGLGIDLARRPTVGFGVFLVTGLIPFLALNDAVLRSARVFRAHVNLVQRVRFPAEVLVIGDMLGALLHHAVAFVVVVAICGAKGHLVAAGAPWLALGTLLLVLWITGLSLLASVLGALLPDLAEVLGLALQIGFYGAPIVYPLAIIDRAVLRTLIELNPVTPLLGVLRAGLIGSAPPGALVIGCLLAGGALLVWAGAAAIERGRTRIPDLL